MFNLKLKTKNLKLPGLQRLDERGYSWVEMAFAVAALGLITFTALRVYKVINRSFWQVDEKSRLERVLVFSMEQMVQELRQAVSITSLPSVNTTGAGVTFFSTPYANNANVPVYPRKTVRLDPAGVTIVSFKIPNLTDPLKRENDATLYYFLRPVTISNTPSVRLYQRMRYYNGTFTQSIPVMASTDQYRAGEPASVATREPGIGTPTVPIGSITPTPSFNHAIGRMPGLYNSPHLSFDDVSFYYDELNALVAVGLTISIRSKSLSWASGSLDRRRLSLTSSVALRRSQ